jgi:NifU-like protein involved in Fe-S cluster formation
MSGVRDPLSAAVRRRFTTLAHAGALPSDEGAAGANGAGPRTASGAAGRRDRGTEVRFDLRLAGQRLEQVRYRAYGCPHTLATCEWLAETLTGKAVDALLDHSELVGGPRAWAAALDVPQHKLGRLLVVEDALRAALRAGGKIGVK